MLEIRPTQILRGRGFESSKRSFLIKLSERRKCKEVAGSNPRRGLFFKIKTFETMRRNDVIYDIYESLHTYFFYI